MAPAPKRATQADIIVPVHKEAHVLGNNVERLQRYLADRFPFSTPPSPSTGMSTTTTATAPGGGGGG